MAGGSLDTEILHDLLSSGTPKKVIAKEFGVTVHSLNKTIAELQCSQGLLLKYKELQNLQLTALQAKCLEAMTPEKIESASLVELATVFKVLKILLQCIYNFIQFFNPFILAFDFFFFRLNN